MLKLERSCLRTTQIIRIYELIRQVAQILEGNSVLKFVIYFKTTEAAVKTTETSEVIHKKFFLKNMQNSQENTCVRVSFL